jgi:4a-hydroxytetrahydrobiopterin dehydratase
MGETISASEFHAQQDLPDWRVLLRRIDATFRADTYDSAAAFVAQVAAAAAAAGQHPDVDLRFPGYVRVTLTDVELAATISGLAAKAGLASEPRSGLALEVAIDAMDIDAVRPFWKAILAYDDEPAGADGQVAALVDPLRIGPAFWFQQMDTPRTQRNRFHIDVTVPHDVADERVAAAVAAGGHLVNDEYARSFWVLADPEGNEACVCTWEDRD